MRTLPTVLFAGLLLFGAGACDKVSIQIPTPSPIPQTPTPVAQPTRVTVGTVVASFRGADSLTTQPFRVEKPWELHWLFKWYIGEKKMTILVFQQGERTTPIATIESGPKPAEGFDAIGKARVDTPPGVYYLQVMTSAKETLAPFGDWQLDVIQP